MPADTTRDNYDFHGLLQKAAGFPFACDFDYVGFWDLRIAVAEHYQVGRVFIAGDAAHSHPPYGGYGLNNGLDDVTNLGWKLAATAQGLGQRRAARRSYTEERRPIFKETGEDFIEGGIRADRDFLARYNPDRDREAFERAWKEHARPPPAPRVADLRAALRGIADRVRPAGAASAAPTARIPSRPAPAITCRRSCLSSGRNVFEELARGFTLLAFDADAKSVQAFEAAATSLQTPFKVVQDSYRDGREAYEARLILVRPDRYVAWIGNAAPGDVAALLGKTVGRTRLPAELPAAG